MERLRLNQFPNVPATGQAILVTEELLDKSVHAIGLKMSGTDFDRSHLSAVNIKLDGKDLVPAISGAQLQKQNDYNGLDDDAGWLWYFFGDPTAQTIKGQHLGDLDLSVYRKPLELRITIAGATSPELEAFALCGVPKMQMGLGYEQAQALQIGVMARTVIQSNSAVNRKAYGIGLGSVAGAAIRRLNYHHSNITAVEHKKQSLTKFDNLTVAENNAIAKNYGRVPQSGLFVLDHVFDGNQGESETTVSPQDGRPWNHQFALTLSGGDTIDVYAELLANWPQI